MLLKRSLEKLDTCLLFHSVTTIVSKLNKLKLHALYRRWWSKEKKGNLHNYNEIYSKSQLCIINLCQVYDYSHEIYLYTSK